MSKALLLTGASGYIGQNIIQHLQTKDYFIIGLTRDKNNKASFTNTQWIENLNEIRESSIDYVINLAGKPIADSWSKKGKQKIIDSRVQTTKALYQWLENNNIRPKKIISGSAIGYYGIDTSETWNEICIETSPPQAIFMSELCQLWEQEALSYPNQNTVIIRLGVVFSKDAKALKAMLLPIKLNTVGRIASGKQPITWIHLKDVLNAIDFLLENNDRHTIYNLTTPELISQQEFVQISAQLLHRKPFLFLPQCVCNLLLGEKAQLITNGQYVKPQALLEEGFNFEFAKLEFALKNL
ncbi:TIGR01777 family protein [Neisseriaceae bacterium PsAf]|nr:TIGR01777 family protein [Neisseriaceae bacterium PsAf]MCV2503354.1 TIGR01777 family oxidoreductase [Neisseriaceae bacterium]